MSKTKLQVGVVGILLVAVGACAQDVLSKRPAHVMLEPVAPVTIRGVKPATAEITFRVRDGFHVNSNQPNSDLLIPTEISLAAIPAVQPGKPVYPAGHDFALTFSPQEKLSVYSGQVTVTVPLSASKPVKAGNYVMKGELKYQACDDRSCFPPKTLALEIPVRVEAK